MSMACRSGSTMLHDVRTADDEEAMTIFSENSQSIVVCQLSSDNHQKGYNGGYNRGVLCGCGGYNLFKKIYKKRGVGRGIMWVRGGYNRGYNMFKKWREGFFGQTDRQTY
ncbi:hypothetical protein DPMN_044029 [Dreissena polymorpha]|uniref:Uncharacterized protein n=1 Tax=Dreissena polymorpha TaxID=45954 RepID=A0A9D4D3V1_DREPO|nr:hypothetical protein DPMN_044029 [Dreissena polymorpha]